MSKLKDAAPITDPTPLLNDKADGYGCGALLALAVGFIIVLYVLNALA